MTLAALARMRGEGSGVVRASVKHEIPPLWITSVVVPRAGETYKIFNMKILLLRNYQNWD